MSASNFTALQTSTLFLNELNNNSIIELYAFIANPEAFNDVTSNEVFGDRVQHTSASGNYSLPTTSAENFQHQHQHQHDVPCNLFPHTLIQSQSEAPAEAGPSYLGGNINENLDREFQVPLTGSDGLVYHRDYPLETLTEDCATTHCQPRVIDAGSVGPNAHETLFLPTMYAQSASEISVPSPEPPQFPACFDQELLSPTQPDPVSVLPLQDGANSVNSLPSTNIRWRNPLTGRERQTTAYPSARRDRLQKPSTSHPQDENDTMSVGSRSGLDNTLSTFLNSVDQSSHFCVLGNCTAKIAKACEYPEHARTVHKINTGNAAGQEKKLCPWPGCKMTVKGLWKHLSIHLEPSLARKCSVCSMLFPGTRTEKLFKHYNKAHQGIQKPKDYEFVFL